MITPDALIGPATISELKKTIAICSQTHQTHLKIVSTGYYTDGSTIFISPPPTELDLVKRWILLEACTIHESWHILFQSNFHLLREFVDKYEKNFKQSIPYIGKIAHDIVNIIEDARIEFFGKQRFLGTINAILFNNAYWLRNRPSFGEMKDWEIFIEGILQLGVCNGLKEVITDSKIIVLVKCANIYLQWAKTQESPKASFLAADKIMGLLLEYFKLEGSYSEQIPSPSDEINFEPQEDESNLSEEDIPELPEKLQDELEKLPKDENQNKPQSDNGSPSTEEQGQDTDDGTGNDTSDGDMNSEESDDGNKEDTTGDEMNESSSGGEKGDTSYGEMGEEASGGEKGDTTSGEVREEASGGEMGGTTSGEMGEGNSSGAIGEDTSNGFSEGGDNENVGNEDNTKEVQLGEGSSEITIVNSEDIDPIKSGLINPANIRIKIDELIKRNDRLSRDKEIEDLAKDVVKQLEASNTYRSAFYTNTYDIGVETDVVPTNWSEDRFSTVYNSLRSLIQVTINQFKVLFKRGSQTTPQLKFGRLDSHNMVRGLINEDPHIFKKNIIHQGVNEIAIALLIDQSGSMEGEKIVNAQRAAILFGEVLNALNLNFAIYGWTDINYYESYPEEIPLPDGPHLEIPQQLNPELFTVFCYKDFHMDYKECKEKLGMIDAMCNNSDHNAIEFMTNQLNQTKKRIKILLVLSDGQPEADSYGFIREQFFDREDNYDRGNIGINVTRQAVERAQKFGIQTLCISIDSVSNYQELIYGRTNYVQVDPWKLQELPVKVAKILALLLRRAGVKV